MKTEVKEVKREPVPGVKNEYIGWPVSSELSDVLLKYVTTDKRHLIQDETGVKVSTINPIIRGANPLAKSNCEAVPAAVRLAIDLAKEREKEIRQDIKWLRSILKA